MVEYDEMLIRAIRHRIAPDIMTTMRDCDVTELNFPRNSVQVPLRADVNVLYDKGLSAFTIQGFIHDMDSESCLMGRSVFSTREFTDARDKASVLHHLFAKLERQFLEELSRKHSDSLFNRLGI